MVFLVDVRASHFRDSCACTCARSTTGPRPAVHHRKWPILRSPKSNGRVRTEPV